MSIHRDRTKIKKSKKSEWKLNNKKNHQKRCTFLYLRDAIENLGGKKGEIKWNGNLPAKKKRENICTNNQNVIYRIKIFVFGSEGMRPNVAKHCAVLCGHNTPEKHVTKKKLKFPRTLLFQIVRRKKMIVSEKTIRILKILYSK